jgi:hypothetical protein
MVRTVASGRMMLMRFAMRSGLIVLHPHYIHTACASWKLLRFEPMKHMCKMQKATKRLGIRGRVTRDERAARVKQLIERGKKEGYLLCDDLSKLLPANCESGPDLDELLLAIELSGLEIVEGPEGGPNDSQAPSDKDDDPVQVYLCEISRSPELTRARELGMPARS